MGHYASECSTKERDEKANLTQQQEDEGPSLLLLETCVPELLPAEESEIIMLQENTSEAEKKESNWYLDSGASSHMSGEKHCFVELNLTITGKVRFGDGSMANICGQGSVLFQCKNTEHLTLQNVYYIPRLRSNIISLGQLDEAGSTIVIGGGHLKLYDWRNKLVVDVERRTNRLYIAKLQLATPINLMARMDDEPWTWHARYGHLNFNSLRKLSRRGMVKGLPSIDQVDKLCDGCLVGKQHRTSFPKKSEFRANKPLELVHSDLCGPITPTTCGAHVKDVTPNLTKLADRSNQAIMLGYESGTKAYRLFDPSRNKIIVSRDVVFEEGRKWQWNNDPVERIKEAEEFTVNFNKQAVNPSEAETPSEVATPSTPSSISSPSTQSQSSNSSSSSSHPQKYKSLQEIYDNTREIEEASLCFLSLEEPTSFEEASKNENWRSAMEQEIASIQKNDDLILTGENRNVINKFKLEMQQKFDMTDLGLLSFYLGIEVKQTATSISVCQTGYAKKILEKMGVGECNPCKLPMEPRTKLSKVVEGETLVDTTLYRSIIGSLRYLVNTRPDITFSVGVLSRFMEKPTTTHMAAVKQVLRYLSRNLAKESG
ncbi:hypothetical protein GH714_019620 [Hevea brasiliensis]|uniref:GAG-pre-integrase domain-containing protein n=1 Tax=Hevea brasiliensis TaxID=3981 RepID=A0A6A6M1A7_HEVBR|nr:hypothetical protein GH714_019620 [Hevea brasiliensis]